jgi:hypothetical protein
MNVKIGRLASAAAIAAALSLGVAATALAAAAQPYIGGTWLVPETASVRTIDGKAPPLKPEAAKAMAERTAARKAGKVKDVADLCLPVGTPRIMLSKGAMMVLQTGRQVTFVHEMNHALRPIYMDEALKPTADIDPTFLGMSVGRWEGDTLVVETAGFRGDTWIDRSGLPKSDTMKVTERLRLVGGTLENRITIDDPVNYTAPWTTKVVYRRAPKGTEMKEDICALKLPMAANIKPLGPPK